MYIHFTMKNKTGKIIEDIFIPKTELSILGIRNKGLIKKKKSSLKYSNAQFLPGKLEEVLKKLDKMTKITNF